MGFPFFIEFMTTLLKNIFQLHQENVLIYAQALFLCILLVLGLAAPESIVFGYFFETIIIGLLHAVKLFLVIKHGKEDKKDHNSMQGYGSIVFFLFHYGMFVGIQMIFVFFFFENSIPGLSHGFALFHNFSVLLQMDGMLLIIGSLLVSNLGYFYSNFWQFEKYKEYAPSEIFFSPYLRIFIQQFVVILAGFFMVFLDSGIVAAALLLLFRLGVDLCMVAIRKHNGFAKELSEKIAKPDQNPSEVQQQLERLSE